MPPPTQWASLCKADLAVDPSEGSSTLTGPRLPLCICQALQVLHLCHILRWVIQSSLLFWLSHVNFFTSQHLPPLITEHTWIHNGFEVSAIVNLKVGVREIIEDVSAAGVNSEGRGTWSHGEETLPSQGDSHDYLLSHSIHQHWHLEE